MSTQPPVFRSRWLPAPSPAGGQKVLGEEPAKPAKPGFEGFEGAEVARVPSPTASGRLLPFDPERHGRTAARLATARCSTCGFGFWRVSARGDASCYACELRAAGLELHCANCKGASWRRDVFGRVSCATCAGGRV
jgi:hypothetical protein